MPSHNSTVLMTRWKSATSSCAIYTRAKALSCLQCFVSNARYKPDDVYKFRTRLSKQGVDSAFESWATPCFERVVRIVALHALCTASRCLTWQTSSASSTLSNCERASLRRVTGLEQSARSSSVKRETTRTQLRMHEFLRNTYVPLCKHTY